jgi:streptomycin 6-kinase
MSFSISPDVWAAAAGVGAERVRWLEALPAHGARIAQAWGLTTGPRFVGGTLAWVVLVERADGTDAVLKVSPPDAEAHLEGDALRHFNGHGAVRLLRASEDGLTLLLERCVPGTSLWSLDEAEGNAAGAAVLQRLWREPPSTPGYEAVEDRAVAWCEDRSRREAAEPGYDAAMMAEALARARELVADPPPAVLLHGDFHPGNVLAAAREPWLAIDAKPLVGEPAFDLAHWLRNRCQAGQQSPDIVAALRWQIDQLSDLLDLDPARVAGWAFVKSLGRNWGWPVRRILHAVVNDG